MSQDITKKSHSMGYKPDIKYIDEYDSSASITLEDKKQVSVTPQINNPTENIQDNFDKIDVASDINTMKVAFRTRILKTEIPLVSSFLDDTAGDFLAGIAGWLRSEVIRHAVNDD